jgi:hypothetical protein
MYGLGFTALGPAPTMILSAIVVIAIGLIVPRLLFSGPP